MSQQKNISGLLSASMLALLSLGLASPAFAAAPLPAVLEQPAHSSPKAFSAAMLAVVNAGARLVALGERGIILFSDDGGIRWTQAKVPVSVSLTAAQFINSNEGWAVGHLGVILHTTDGGKSWGRQLNGVQAAALVLAEAQKRIAAGDQSPAAQKALDEAHQLVDDGPDKPFLNVYFENAQSGFAVGAYNMIFRTQDGGKSWQPWQSHIDNPKGLHLYSMQSSGQDLYLVGEQGLLLRSSDHGARFTPMPSPYKGSFFGLITARNGELLLFGLRGNVFRSGDQGRSWQKIVLSVAVSIAAGIELKDGSLALVSQTGDLLLSQDTGQSFAPYADQNSLPVASLAQASDGTLILAGLRGLKRISKMPGGSSGTQ